MSNHLKSEIEKDFSREKNYDAILSKVERVNVMKKFKMSYAVCAICAVALVGVIGVKMVDFKPNANQESRIELNVNQLPGVALAKLDADMRVMEKDSLPEKYDFMESVKVPTELALQNIYTVYTRKDFNTENYDILHDYVFSYGETNDKNVIIKFSEVGEPLRDYFIKNEDQKSVINNVEVEVSQYQDMYIVTFGHNDIQFDIETKGISEEELVELLQSIIIEIEK